MSAGDHAPKQAAHHTGEGQRRDRTGPSHLALPPLPSRAVPCAVLPLGDVLGVAAAFALHRRPSAVSESPGLVDGNASAVGPFGDEREWLLASAGYAVGSD